jgi:hypothetical protein
LKLLLGAISTIQGKVDKEAVFKAMNNITKPATTLFGAYNTTKPNSQAAWARAFDTSVYLYVAKNGAFTSLGAPTDVRSIFN